MMKMTRLGARIVGAALSMAVLAATLHAQAPAAAAAQAEAAAPTLVGLRLEVTIGRYQGDKPVSRMPYVFSVTGEGGGRVCRLRIGAQIPIRGANETTYRDVGTNIDCGIQPTGDGRFMVTVSIQETSVMAAQALETNLPEFAGTPIFRSYQSNNSVVLKDGESQRFTTASDRISGETVSVEVTLTVLK